MAFVPTHTVPGTAGGIATWPAPDPAAPEGPRLEAGLEVAVLAAQDDGWSHVECANGWRAWVDGRVLEPVVRADAAPGPSAAPAPSPSPQAVDAPVQVAGVRITTPLVGGALVLVAALLPWISLAGITTESSLGIPIKVLFDPKTQSTGGLKLGYVMVVLGGLTVAAGLSRVPPQVGRYAGGAAMLLATLFLAQLQRGIGAAQAGTVFGVLGLGVYLTMVGGLLCVMSKSGTSS